MTTLNNTFPKDGNVALTYAIDNATGLLGTIGGFLTAKTGRKIVITYTDSTKATISSVSYYDSNTLLYTITQTQASTTDSFERTA